MIPAEQRVVIAVDLDYFYAQCEEVRNPAIRGRPVVICVFSGRTSESGAVRTANYVARNLGVKSGIPIVLAKKILQKNPESVFLPMDIEYYRIVSDRIMAIIKSHGEKFEQSSIDEAYLDVSGQSRTGYEHANLTGKKIKDEILLEESLTCSVGIGPNKLVAKMAVDSKKPDGFTTVLPGDVKSFLDPLPVGKLFGIGPKTEEKLNELGITTVQELGKSDVTLLSEEFGAKLGFGLFQSANGIDEDPVLDKDPEQMSRIVTLKRNTEIFDFEESMKPLAEDISSRLKAGGFLCRSVGIILIAANLKTTSRNRTLDSPTDSGAEISKNAKELFESFFQENTEQRNLAIRRAGIRVSELTKSSSPKMRTLTDFF